MWSYLHFSTYNFEPTFYIAQYAQVQLLSSYSLNWLPYTLLYIGPASYMFSHIFNV